MDGEFQCRECGRFWSLENKGQAVDDDGKAIDVCWWCCVEEQKRQFYSEM